MRNETIKKDHWPEGTHIKLDRSIFPNTPTITAYEDGYAVGEYKTEQDAVDTLNMSLKEN